jgi:hypothetical protein
MFGRRIDEIPTKNAEKLKKTAVIFSGFPY